MTSINSVSFQILVALTSITPMTLDKGTLCPILCLLYVLKRFLDCSILVWNKDISGFSMARGAPIVSHALYADNIIIFLKATYRNACNLRNLLDKFCR